MAYRATGIKWRAARAACLTVLALAAVPPAARADTSLIAQWRFDEGAGNVALDDGPFSLNGVLGTSSVPGYTDPQRIDGFSGGALRFDGDAVVRLPDSPQLAPQSLSLEAVVRASGSPGQWRYILSRGGRECWSGAYGLYTAEAGGLALYVFDGTHYVVSATARASDVWDGAWHHVAGTFDGRELRLYVDGRPVGEPMDAALQIDYAATAGHASIGQYAGSCNLPYLGDLDLLRLTAGALSAETIARDAGINAPITDPTPDTPLPPAAPGTVLQNTGPGTSGSVPKSCVVRLSRTRVVARRRTVVGVHVVGVHRVTVAARRGRTTVATARTNGAGVARLVVRTGPGRLTVAVVGCTSARLQITARH